MQYTKLGNSGLTVSRIGLGCMSYGDKRWREWAADRSRGARSLRASRLQAGINFFDTADVYSCGASERITGRWLGEMANRDDIVVATKVYGAMGGADREDPSRPIAAGSAASTSSRLARPRSSACGWITSTSTRSIAGTSVRRSRKPSRRSTRWCKPARSATWAPAAWRPGSSPRRCSSPRENGWHRFVSMQNHYNLVYREEEREMIPLCIDQGVGLIPWSPLARGFLSGTRKRASGDSHHAGARPTSSPIR